MFEQNITVFKDLFKSTDMPFIVPLWKVLQRIKVGKSRKLIDEIRQGNKELKKSLPSILFGGEFAERRSNGLKKHSGLMIVDFDKYPDNETMNEHLETLKQNPHFVSLFVSPSGNGIKGVVRVNDGLDKDSHPKYFKAFQEKFQFEYFDMANSNVDRVCFESYDPNIYINYDATPFVTELIDEGYEYAHKVPVLPITNEDLIIDKIMKWNWKTEFTEGERNRHIFNLAGAFCEYGVSQSHAEFWILRNLVTGSSFSKKETLTAVNSAYRSRQPNTKFFEDYHKIDRVKVGLSLGKKRVMQEFNIDEKTYEHIKEAKENDQFWYFDNNNKVKIDHLKYKLFLEFNGFKKYFPGDTQKPMWVKIKSNIVKETTTERIKDFVLNYLLEQNETDVWRYCVNYGNIFSEQYLLMLESIDLAMLKDTKTTSFIAFQNGILEVTENEIKLTDYLDVNGYVWESHIIKRDFDMVEDFSNDYKTFINNISNNNPTAIECVIGYLLSTYKNKMNNKCIILNDEVISDNPEGGTGKGLFVQGLRQIRRVSVLDGKMHDDKKSFPYQTVSTDTQILVFDDVKKNFDLELKFSLVTEGMTIERKNKDAIKLSVEESPKMLISTNYAIKGEGNSHDRRRHEIEIAQYYGKNLTPFDEFGRQLFDDWNDDDYLRFDNYMVYCLQAYLKNGLIQQNAKNIKMRRFIAETSMEFFEWIEDRENFPFNQRHNKAEYFQNFINDYKDYQKFLRRKRFNIWVQKYASFKGHEFKQGNSNGERWFTIETEPQEHLEEVEF
jgi:hypothetical protein